MEAPNEIIDENAETEYIKSYKSAGLTETEKETNLWEIFKQFPEEKQKLYLLSKGCHKNDFNIMNIEISNGLSADYCPDEFHKEYDLIHKDNLSGKYHHTNHTYDYIRYSDTRSKAGGENKDTQLIHINDRQILFFDIPRKHSDDDRRLVLNDFRKWLEENYVDDDAVNTRYKTFSVEHKNIIEVRFYGIQVDNRNAKVGIMKKFLTDYNGSRSYQATILFDPYIKRNVEEYEEVISTLSDYFPLNEFESDGKSYIISCRRNKTDNMLTDSIKKCLDKHIKSLGIKPGSDLPPINIKITNNYIKHANQVNIAGKDNYVYNYVDENSKNINDFISHIKNDKPEWYIPGKFIPKMLLVEKFNERYDEKFSTRSFMNLLKKYDIKNILMRREGYQKCDIKNYGNPKKQYKGFIAKEI